MNMPVSGRQARVDRTRRIRATMKAPSVSVAAAVAGILFGAGTPVYAQQEAADARSFHGCTNATRADDACLAAGHWHIHGIPL